MHVCCPAGLAIVAGRRKTVAVDGYRGYQKGPVDLTQISETTYALQCLPARPLRTAPSLMHALPRWLENENGKTPRDSEKKKAAALSDKTAVAILASSGISFVAFCYHERYQQKQKDDDLDTNSKSNFEFSLLSVSLFLHAFFFLNLAVPTQVQSSPVQGWS